jgi:hypothetical protein
VAFFRSSCSAGGDRGGLDTEHLSGSIGAARFGDVVEDLLISRVWCKLSGVGHGRLQAYHELKAKAQGQGELMW